MRPYGRSLLVTVILCLGLLPARAGAVPIDLGTLSSGDFEISGTFTADNDVALFSFFLPGDAVLSLEFTSLLEPAPGEDLLGFDPNVTFFGPGGQFGDGYLVNAQFDAAFGVTSIVDLLADLPPLQEGNYVIAVSLFENLYSPPDGGFQYAGAGNENYTTTLYAVPGCSMFLTPSDCRTGRFDATLTIELENAQPVPESGSLTMLALGGAALLARRERRSRRGPKANPRN